MTFKILYPGNILEITIISMARILMLNLFIYVPIKKLWKTMYYWMQHAVTVIHNIIILHSNKEKYNVLKRIFHQFTWYKYKEKRKRKRITIYTLPNINNSGLPSLVLADFLKKLKDQTGQYFHYFWKISFLLRGTPNTVLSISVSIFWYL